MVRGRPRKIDPDTALDIAVRLFWDQGFEGTSMNDLVEATGMAKPGLYAAFGCKEQLYIKALTHYLDQSAPMFKELVASPDNLPVVLKRFLSSIRDGAIDKTCPSGCFVVNSVVE
ncbi:MAG: TetR/AcrR family transcriptional regulator, partial [Sneathiella sp.]